MSGDSTMVLVKPNGQKRAQQTLPPPGIRLSSAADEWPHPFFRAEILEYRPRGGDSDCRWDMHGWYGRNTNRLWIKSEGTSNTDRRRAQPNSACGEFTTAVLNFEQLEKAILFFFLEVREAHPLLLIEYAI
jgi:hypothetical protein